MTLNKKELLQIKGGSINTSLINAVARGVSIFLDLGKLIGSAIRRATSGKSCSL